MKAAIFFMSACSDNLYDSVSLLIKHNNVFFSPNSDTRAWKTAGFSSCKIKLLDWPLW